MEAYGEVEVRLHIFLATVQGGGVGTRGSVCYNPEGRGSDYR
jgi:hypothetical protein